MDVSLPPDLEHEVEKTVASGRYRDAEDVVRAGLRLLFKAERTRADRLAKFQSDIQAGLDQLDRGESVSAEQLRENISKRMDAFR